MFECLSPDLGMYVVRDIAVRWGSGKAYAMVNARKVGLQDPNLQLEL